jgi:hypothetical protein
LLPATGMAAQGADFWPDEGEALEEEGGAKDADDHAEADAFAVVGLMGIEDGGEDGNDDEADGAADDGEAVELAADPCGAGAVIGEQGEGFLALRAVVWETRRDQAARGSCAFGVHLAKLMAKGRLVTRPFWRCCGRL